MDTRLAGFGALEDIKNLVSLPDLQKDYLHYWIKKLNLNTFGLLTI